MKINNKKFFFFIFLIVFFSFYSLKCFANEIPFFLQEKNFDAKNKRRVAQKSGRIAVSADFSIISPESNLNTFKVAVPGKILILRKVKIEKRGKNDFTWFGEVLSEKNSSAFFTVKNDIMMGRINSLGETYYIDPNKNDYIVVVANKKQQGPLDDDFLVPAPPKETFFSPYESKSIQEDGSRIDIMVLYTQAMKDKYGATLDTLIQSFIDETNQAYADSLITTTISLVHSELYTNPLTDEAITIGLALETLTNDPDVTTLRNSYKADLVTLLRVYQGAGPCGQAWIMSPPDSNFEKNAFSVIEVKRQSEAGNGEFYCDTLSFAHELGHNFGCTHDRSHVSENDPKGAYDYSYGYDSQEITPTISVTFATIMSYDDGRIPYFSNPLVSYQGTPIGKEEGLPDAADNAKTINNTKILVANFRTGKDKNLSISPPSKDFGKVKISESKIGTFTISNNSGSSIVIDSTIITGTNYTEFSIITDTCTSNTVASKSSCTIDISFSPKTEGEKNSFLSLVYNNLSDSPITATLTGTGVLCGSSPQLTEIQNKKETYGGNITLSGSDFCNDEGKVIFSKKGKKVETNSFVSWKDDEIILDLPWGIKAGKNKVQVITSEGLKTNKKSFKFLKPIPKISTLSPKKGSPLSNITISGSNFGVLDKKSKVLFNNTKKASVMTWTNDTINAVVPDFKFKKKKKTYRIKIKTRYGTSKSKKFKVIK